MRTLGLGVQRRHVTPLVALLLLGSACQSGSQPRSHSPPEGRVPTTTPTLATPPPPSTGFDDPIDVAVGGGVVWVGNYASSTLEGFRQTDLRDRSGRASPTPFVVLSDLGGPNQIVFDQAGDMWVAAWDENLIRTYTVSSMSASGPAPPLVTIRGRALASPTDLAFDGSGDLWVANQATGDVVRYAANDLLTSGHPSPRLVLHPFPAGTPEAIAFDPTGSLWVSNYDDDFVAVFDRSQLARSGAPRPVRRLILPPLSGPIGLTFDHRGRLWVAESKANAIAVFSDDASGRASPELTLTGPALVMPHTVTFSSDGSIWVPCYNDTVLRFDDPESQGSDARPTLILE